jgi:hypothetical protein
MLEVNCQDHHFKEIDRKAFSNVRPMFLSTRVTSVSPSPTRSPKHQNFFREQDSPGLENPDVREEIYNSFGIVASHENRAR